MYEPLEQLIDRARQRHFTDEEISGIASHAQRLAVGCDVLARLRPLETSLVQAALRQTAEHFPDLEATVPGATPMLEQSLVWLLRQTALAMAVDDYTRWCDFLCDLQAAFWQSGVSGEVTEYATAALRDLVWEKLAGQAASACDAWLRLGARFLTVSAEVGATRALILDEAVAALFTQYPDLASRYADCARKTAQDFEHVLLHSIRGMLPDGAQRVFRMLRTYHEAIVQGRFDVTIMEDAYELLTNTCRTHLDAGRSLELFAQLQPVGDFITLSADLGMHMDALLTQSVDTLYHLHPDQDRAAEYIEKTARDERLVLEHCAYATLPGGQEELIRLVMGFQGTLVRFNFGARLVTDAYKILLDTCRTTLRARSRATLIPVLHRTAHVLALGADLAEKGEVMLTGVTERLATHYPEYYAAHPTARLYTRRDQEQLLFHLALGLLPGAADYSAGRFAMFGETLLAHRLDPALLRTSFAMLEEACMGTLQAQSLALLMPYWHQVRRYLEVCLALGPVEESIVEGVCTVLHAACATAVESYADGYTRAARDVRTLLRTAALALLPGGEEHLVRGLSRCVDNVLDVKMPRAMLHTTCTTLLHAVRTVLPAVQQAWFLPVLQRSQSCIEVAADLGTHIEAIVTPIMESTLVHLPQQVRQVPGVRRQGAVDLVQTLRCSTLALVPGGSRHLAQGLWEFSAVLAAQQLGAEVLREAYETFGQAVQARLDATLQPIFGPVLETTLQAMTLLAELAECADVIIAESVESLFRAYPAVLQSMRGCRDKTVRDMHCLLRCAALAVAEGGGEVTVQPVKTDITPQLALPSHKQAGETGPRRRAGRLHERR